MFLPGTIAGYTFTIAVFLRFSIVALCSRDVEPLFRNYIQKFAKTYADDPAEYRFRFKNFKVSLERIAQLNRENPEGEFGLTPYSDMSSDEFQSLVIGFTPRQKRSVEDNLVTDESKLKTEQLKNLPQKHDWRDYAAVTAVKNQKTCGACWAFSTVETMESMQKLETGILQELSVQQVIDCARGGNYGCMGGDTCTVLSWMNLSNFELTSESDYPLTDTFGTCKQLNSSTKVKIDANFTCNQYKGNELAMVELLANHGPLVAAVDATTWQDYLGGIIQYHCDANTNHAVQIVGYDTTGEVPYYIVRNSWGAEFGHDGYLYIRIGNNLCGIAERVSALSVTIA